MDPLNVYEIVASLVDWTLDRRTLHISWYRMATKSKYGSISEQRNNFYFCPQDSKKRESKRKNCVWLFLKGLKFKNLKFRQLVKSTTIHNLCAPWIIIRINGLKFDLGENWKVNYAPAFGNQRI